MSVIAKSNHYWHSQTRPRASESGTSLVEFALVFLLLATILFGIMGFADALYTYHFLGHESKEATRWAAVNGSSCTDDGTCTAPATSGDISTYVQSHVPPGVTAGNLATTATWPVETNGPAECAGNSSTNPAIPKIPNYPGCTVQVTVSYPFQFSFPLLNKLIPAAENTTAPCTKPGICMSSTSDMVIVH
jgi:Flp pilus assembly protein TadG